MESERLKLNNYKITGDDTLLDEQNHITPEIRRIIEELRPDIEKGRKYLIKKLNRLCLKYPKTPTFKNFLSAAYQKNGNMEQAYAVNRWIVNEHPDYLMGKINLAVEFLFKNEPEKVPGILGDVMEIGELYPERKEFHLDEVIGFNTVSVQYFLAVDNIEQAEMRVKLLEDIDKENPRTQYAQQILQEWYFRKAAARVAHENQQRKEVTLKDKRSHLQTNLQPSFHFPEQIGWLYKNDFSISREKIAQILQLDDSKLIEDLEMVLQDSIARFDHFVEQIQEEGYDNKKSYFPIHALLLLASLKSKNSLAPILELLKQDQDYIDFWFGDFINYLADNALYHCGRQQIHRLFEFLKLPNIPGMNKAIVGEAMVKIIDDCKEERAHFIEEYRKVLKVYITKADDDNYCDTEAIAFVISDVIDLGYKELLPEIKQLFELGIVATFISGSYRDVEIDIVKPSFGQNLDFIRKDIYDQYDEMNGYEKESTTQQSNEDFFTGIYNEEMSGRALLDDDFNEPISKPKKIGRNDPCPCGSGKKYKKCCLDK